MFTPFAFVKSAAAAAPAFVGLLDTYPNASVGLSLRRLSSTYTGSLIRVRRSSDDAEQNIGYVGESLDTSSLSSFVGASSGFITTWYDQSNNSRDFYQTTQSFQPLIVSSGSILTITGSGAAYPQIRFDGSQWFQLGVAMTGFSSASIFTSTRANPTAVGGKFWWNFDNDNAGANHHPFTTTDAYEGAFKTTRPQVITAANSLFSLHIWGVTSATNDYKVSQNLTTVFSSSVSTVQTNVSTPYIGRAAGAAGSNCYPGSFQEVVIWYTNQDSNRTGIINNINSFYSVF